MEKYSIEFKRPSGGRQRTLSDGAPIGIAISAGAPYHRFEYLEPVLEEIVKLAPNSPLLLLVFDQIQGRSLAIKGQDNYAIHGQSEKNGSIADELGRHLGAKFITNEWGQISPAIQNKTKILRWDIMSKLPAYEQSKQALVKAHQDLDSPVYKGIYQTAENYLSKNQDFVRKDHQTSFDLSADFQLSECAAEAAVVDAYPEIVITYVGGQHPVLRAMSRGLVPDIPESFHNRRFLSIEIYEGSGADKTKVRFESVGITDLAPAPQRPILLSSLPSNIADLSDRLSRK